MKESMWGYLIIALGVVIIAILVFVQRLTTINEEDYHLSREIMKASMLDAVDYGTYMKTGKLVMSKEKFVAVFTRRFAESVTPDKEYTLDFYDIHEYPPKATVRIGTSTGETSINGNGIDLDINTFISAILVTSEADGLITINIEAEKGDVNGDGYMNPEDIYEVVRCYLDSSKCGNINSNHMTQLKKLGGDTTKFDLDDVVILEQAIMHGYKLGDIDKSGKIDEIDVKYIRNYLNEKSVQYNRSLDLFQKIVGDVTHDGKITKADADKLELYVKTGNMSGVPGDINGDGMVTAADALLLRDYKNYNISLTDSELARASGKTVNGLVTQYRDYLKGLIG